MIYHVTLLMCAATNTATVGITPANPLLTTANLLLFAGVGLSFIAFAVRDLKEIHKRQEERIDKIKSINLVLENHGTNSALPPDMASPVPQTTTVDLTHGEWLTIRLKSLRLLLSRYLWRNEDIIGILVGWLFVWSTGMLMVSDYVQRSSLQPEKHTSISAPAANTEQNATENRDVVRDTAEFAVKPADLSSFLPVSPKIVASLPPSTSDGQARDKEGVLFWIGYGSLGMGILVMFLVLTHILYVECHQYWKGMVTYLTENHLAEQQ